MARIGFWSVVSGNEAGDLEAERFFFFSFFYPPRITLPVLYEYCTRV